MKRTTVYKAINKYMKCSSCLSCGITQKGLPFQIDSPWQMLCCCAIHSYQTIDASDIQYKLFLQAGVRTVSQALNEAWLFA